MAYAVAMGIETRRRGPDVEKTYIDLWTKCGAIAKSGPGLWQAHCRSGSLSMVRSRPGPSQVAAILGVSALRCHPGQWPCGQMVLPVAQVQVIWSQLISLS